MRIYIALLAKIFMFLLFCMAWNCGAQGRQPEDVSTQIRIVNKSAHVFTYVSLFSMKFPDLYPGDTTSYKELHYDPLRDNPLINCINEGLSYGRYVKIPGEEVRFYTYIIDSLNNRLIYIRSREEQINQK